LVGSGGYRERANQTLPFREKQRKKKQTPTSLKEGAKQRRTELIPREKTKRGPLSHKNGEGVEITRTEHPKNLQSKGENRERKETKRKPRDWRDSTWKWPKKKTGHRTECSTTLKRKPKESHG